MEKKKLLAPDKFPFPFQPYDIQNDFMKALYETIEKGQIGIFESPTGTGKSLSMICGAFKWLQDHQHRMRDENLTSADEDINEGQESSEAGGEPSWINDFFEKKAKEEVTKKNTENLKREERRTRMLKKLRKGKSIEIFDTSLKFARKRKNDADDETLRLMEQAKRELEGNTTKEMVDPKELEFLPEDYDSDEDHEDLDEDQEGDDFEDLTRIYFCSRTHTQLSQFVHEIIKSPYNPTNKQQNQVDLDLTMTTIASRNSLCVNETVKSLKSLSLINERCLDLQSSKKSKAKEPTTKRRKSTSSGSCPYVKNVEGKTKLVGEILSKATDVEQLANIGRQHQACPYYAARKAANYSQLVLLPYQAILHKETRLASNVKLKNSVVIIDEAHNLIEAINSMHSCQISLTQVKIAWGQLTRYHARYSKMLAARNLFYVKQLLHVLKCFAEMMKPSGPPGKAAKQQQTDSEVKTVVDFLASTKLDNVNWFKLVRYCQESKISRKLNGFVEKHEQVTATVGINQNSKSSPKPSKLSDFLQNIKNQGAQQQQLAVMEATKPGEKETTIRCPLQNIEGFFQSLASASEDGRIVITRNCLPSPKLKFLLLNPAQHFKVLLDECRSVIIAGGTMKPSSILINQLLATGDVTSQSISRARFVEFTCGHVVDGSTQLLPALLKRGPSGQDFEFSYERQSDTGQIDQLGRTVINICQILPGGIVCFFPSYKFSKVVYQRWKSNGVIERIEKKKKVFCETQNETSVDSVLEKYRRRIEECKTNSTSTENGAVLLSVVGGKLSEGINFSDDLGRCVMMIGLPYPNIKSVELQEKMKYLDANLPRTSGGMKPSSIYYEELCMKAVNQSIGRAIRHKNDYACILLVDKRFARSSVQSKLPDWISNHMKVHENFGTCFSSIRKFFLEKSTSK